MKNKVKYIVILVLILLSVTGLVTYSYFTANVISNDVNDVNVSSGKLNVRIDDTGVNSSEISPIYDSDFEMLSYNKDFEIISDSTLNSCNKLYLHVNEISDSLKSEYFKYKIIGEELELEGNFINAKNGEDLLLLDNLFLEKGTTKYFDLYMWVSYQDDVDQLSMLNGKIKSNIFVEGFDSKENTCIFMASYNIS